MGRFAVSSQSLTVLLGCFAAEWSAAAAVGWLIAAAVRIGDSPALVRDKLVKKGELNFPLTDTKEFRKILKRQIQRWDGEKFVQMFPGCQELFLNKIVVAFIVTDWSVTAW